MKKVFVVFMLQFFVASCSADTFHFYKDDFQEMVQDRKQRKVRGNENDVNDLEGCEYLSEIGNWENNFPNDKERSKTWSRHQGWRKSAMYHGTGVGLDLPTQYFKNIKMALSDKSLHPIYIGPWQYSPTLQKTIRFFAYYPKEGGDIQYQYESQTEENKSIPQKAFSLSPTAKIAPDRFGLCVVKWTAKYGYNAIAETKKVYPKGVFGFFARIFRDYELVPTGKIIEAKE